MYSIGEFSRIAQVSKRLLRYYNEIGLFQPIKVEPASGHRYYSASQLPTLNRILALKELGLSLDQIRRFIKDDISLEEIQGMLMMKKAELEQQVLDELKRIRTIESRLKQIKDRATYVRDVVVKQVPQQKLIGIRKALSTSESGDNLFWSVMDALPRENDSTYGDLTIVLHEDGVSSDRTDIELGRLLKTTSHAPLTTYDGMTLAERSLPEETMATFIPPTASCAKLLGYNAIGEWVEANQYTFAGPVRLVFLELPKQPGDSDFVTEIQFPVRKRSVELDLLSIN
ncbi:MerR family transcriptional regulator [Mastigocoleus testarum]|uniref:Transcriptional regulator n=1 Tax=Mastigocoleus testarum BC008 TaxID=371196 RepID=A0A0V7ZXM1_9CYAN|nr:MerR family transcriptional regulator [Mastigocoleus testarum]KST69321.1 transcriptional regulator [Mastigocoleus testarum BC008]KST69331.1 transcriptional regulator [Mastigocoleus testarum BC008]